MNNLRDFPLLSAVVEEANRPTIRQVLFDRYRIIYRYEGKVVEILRIWPAAKPLRLDRLESE